MIIDFHTHIFPDEIAENAIKTLEVKANIKAYTNGTFEGLKQSMRENHIDYSIVLPVVTKPSQFETVNKYACSITGKDGIISFGGIHPDTEDYIQKLTSIKEMGLLGIKLHPDYQNTFIDDPKMIRLIQSAVDLDLIVVIHSGIDIGLLEPVHSTAKRAAKMLSQVNGKEPKIVLAHMGAYDDWDDVENYLAGKNVWFDISYSLGNMEDDQLVRIIRKHGPHHILFATDSPWGGQRETFDHLHKLGLTKQEFELILYQNAKKLLHISI
jgi:predicted TIM-barrel fold metal-dependent hydrolase